MFFQKNNFTKIMYHLNKQFPKFYIKFITFYQKIDLYFFHIEPTAEAVGSF